MTKRNHARKKVKAMQLPMIPTPHPTPIHLSCSSPSVSVLHQPWTGWALCLLAKWRNQDDRRKRKTNITKEGCCFSGW